MSVKRFELSTICRLNQARSIISSATIRNIFSDLQISSAGIEALSGRSIPKITEILCTKWGLNQFDRYSKTVGEIIDSLPEAEILAADNLVASELARYFPASRIGVIPDYVDHDLLIPIDPVGLSPQRYELELSKVAIASIRWVEQIVGRTLKNLDSVIYLNKSSILSMHPPKDLELSDTQIIIDSDIKIPDPKFWLSQGFDVRYFNPRDLGNFSILPNRDGKPLVLLSKFEVDNSGAIFLSKQWREFLFRLQSEFNCRIISGLTESQPVLTPEHILAMAHSSDVHIIEI